MTFSSAQIQDIIQGHSAKIDIHIPPPTEEQVEILKTIISGKNTQISSVPGSGKTTLILYISILMNSLEVSSSDQRILCPSHPKILVLMYNKALALESRKKFKTFSCKNLKTQTIHSFACSEYKTDQNSFDDTLLLDVLETKISSRQKFEYDMIIVDEFQDATHLLFRFVHKIATDCKNFPQLVLLGDPKQELYKFRGADSRFMTLSDQLLGTEFVKLKMTRTNRCPEKVCELVNTCCDETIVTSAKTSTKGHVRVCIGNLTTIFFDEISRLKSQGVKFRMDEIMIIVPSLKRISALKTSLARRNIFVYASDNDSVSGESHKLFRDKVFITTFHGSKGLERKIVFISSFSNDYYKYYATDADPNIIPNTFYVGMTRSSEYLFLVRDAKSEFPAWCTREKLETLKERSVISLYGEPLKKTSKDPDDDTTSPTVSVKNVTDVTKNLSTKFKQMFCELVKFHTVHKKKYKIDYIETYCTRKSDEPSPFYDNGFALYENLSRYYGTSVTVMFEMWSHYQQSLKGFPQNSKPVYLDKIDKEIQEMHESFEKGNEFTRYYNRHLAGSAENVSFKDVIRYTILEEAINKSDASILNQIWFLPSKDIFEIPLSNLSARTRSHSCDDEDVSPYSNSKIFYYMSNVVAYKESSEFEKFISTEIWNGIELQGKIDILVGNHRIVEIKFKDSIDTEDLVQLFLYRCILAKSTSLNYKCQLFNAKTGELYEMKHVYKQTIDTLIKELFDAESESTSDGISDEEFVGRYALQC